MQGKVRHRFCRSAKRSLAKATASFVLIAICALQLVAGAKADIVNTSQATGTYKGVTVNYGSSTQSVLVATANPAITLTKIDKGIVDANGNGIRDAGDKISYGFTVANTGNVTINTITLTDAGTVIAGGPITLAPGASDTTSFTATYTLTAADFISGTHSNTGTVNGTAANPAATAVNASSTVVTSLSYVASFTFTKTASLATSPPKANDTVTYTLTVTNTGNSTLSNITVTDPLLASNEKVNARFMAMIDGVNQPDAQTLTTASLGEVSHTTGIVEATNRRAAALLQVPALASEFSASRQLVRMSGKSGPLVAGEKIGFIYTASNSGEGPITDVRIAQPDSFAFGSELSLLNPNETDAASIIFTRDLTDEDIQNGATHSNAYVTWKDRGREQLLALAESIPLGTIKVYDQFATASISPISVPTLNPGQSTIFTAPYLLKQADIDAGTLHNLATATAKDIGNLTITHTATFDLPLPQAPAVGVVKSGTLTTATPGVPKVGDTINYTFAVTNLGNVTLAPVTVTDATPGVLVSGAAIASLAPGVTNNSNYTATHVLTQADIDAGQFQNQATTTAKPPLTAAISSASDPVDPKLHNPTIVPIASKPAIALLKQVASVEDVNANGRNDAGDKIHYTFTVTNTGNVTLHGITIVDKLGAPVVITGSPIVAPLAPGGTDSSVTGVYVITQADMDAGQVTNTATATGTAPNNAKVSDDSDPALITGNAPTVQPLTQAPQAALFKKMSVWKDLNSDGFVDAGDELDYTFIVQNTGNVTLTNVKLTELMAGAVMSGNAPGITLAPGAVNGGMFTAKYTITAADEAAGVVKNRAQLDTTQIANTLSNSGDLTTSTPGTTDTPVEAAPKFGVELLPPSYVDTNADGIVDAGDTLTYQVQVKNTGLMAINGLSLADANVSALLTVSGGPIGTLLPGAVDTTTFAATHILTAADVTAGIYNAQAKGTGTASTSSGLKTITDLSHSSSFTQDAPTPFVITANPLIAVLKIWDHYEDATGTTILNPATGVFAVYKISVKNLGNIDFNLVSIAEKVGFNGVISGSTPFALAVGVTDTTHFSVKHQITNAEMLAGHFDDQVVATGTNTAKGIATTDTSDGSSFAGNAPTVVNVTANPQAALFKQQSGFKDNNNDGILDVGDEIDYAFAVQNTGNVTLTNLNLTELLAGAVVIGNAPGISLAPGATDSTTFKGKYIVTAADQAAGAVKNSARVDSNQVSNVISRSGNPLSSLPGTTDSVIQPTPTVAVLLLAPTYVDTNGDGVVDAGDTLNYPVQVKNTSIVPLTAASLTDVDPAGLLTFNGTLAGPLAAGATDTTTFRASHIINAADLSAGIYNAQTKVTGTVTSGSGSLQITDLSDPADFTKDAPTPYMIAPDPRIAALKTFDHFENASGGVIPAPATGAFVIYKITVKNTGNVYFDNVAVAENAGFTGVVSGATPFALAPGAVDASHFTAKHQITNAEMIAGQVANQVVATGSNSAKAVSATDISDVSDFNGNAPTVMAVTANPQLAIVKTYKVEDVNGNGANDMGDIIHYSFTVANLGNVDLAAVTLLDASAVLPIPPPVIGLLPVGAQDTTTFTATHVITAPEVANGAYSNQATVSGVFDPTKPTINSDSDNASLTATTKHPTITPLSIARPVLTKTAERSQVKRGDVVAYTITALNVSSIQYQLVDIMPPGFSYAAGSATANGVAVTPVMNGQVLTFNSLVPTASKLVLKLKLIASATLGGGKFVNNARIIQQDNNNVLAVAQATVEIVPDAVFDCSDIIGRVFDDLNGDGYYQAGEPGLPGVRMATLNGVLITTDDQGRYHVPCAAIPDAAIGSNFLLKLDPRTLPQGYKVTTENPRDVRVTRGKVTELNFGAAKHREVKVDVTGKAFDPESTDLTPTWANGVTRLCKILSKTSSDLSLVYHQKGETGELAQSRMDALEATIRQTCDAKHTLKIKTQVEEGK